MKYLKEVIGALFLLLIFIFISYTVQSNLELIKTYMVNDSIGMIIYLLVLIASIVLAPVTVMPLIPIASNLWGVTTTAILSIIGWTIGAWIAFAIARKYGIPIITKFISVKNINQINKFIPEENLFLSIIFLRMTIPVDGLSYGVGLFTKMKTRDYLIATIIGLIPFSFLFAYLGTVNFYFQMFGFIAVTIILLLGILINKKIKFKKIRKIKSD
jgi:uncharacterized membrane protein YdjX (TVP38/TMEM64 family)